MAWLYAWYCNLLCLDALKVRCASAVHRADHGMDSKISQSKRAALTVWFRDKGPAHGVGQGQTFGTLPWWQACTQNEGRQQAQPTQHHDGPRPVVAVKLKLVIGEV